MWANPPRLTERFEHVDDGMPSLRAPLTLRTYRKGVDGMRPARLAYAIGGLLPASGAVGTTATPATAFPGKSTSGPADHGAVMTSVDQENLAWPEWNWSDPLKDKPGQNRTVTIPEEDRFTPFAVTIHTGDSVTWKNEDTDDHTLVTDDAFTTTDNHGVNQLLPGTDANNGKPSKFTLTFREPGTFVYYCRFHSRLDQFNQPVAPGRRAASRTRTATSAHR
jgi:plastocyanin